MPRVCSEPRRRLCWGGRPETGAWEARGAAQPAAGLPAPTNPSRAQPGQGAPQLFCTSCLSAHSPGWSRVFRSSWGCCFLCLFPLQQVWCDVSEILLGFMLVRSSLRRQLTVTFSWKEKKNPSACSKVLGKIKISTHFKYWKNNKYSVMQMASQLKI